MKIAEKVNNEGKQCIITGDLNIDGLKIAQNQHVKSFFDGLLEQNYIPVITLPTRIVDDRGSTIDHIIINGNTIENNNLIQTGNIYCDISDHLPNFLILGNNRKDIKEHRPYVRIFGEKNEALFKEKLEKADWDKCYQSKNVDEALNTFYEIYNKAFAESFPVKKLSRNRAKDKH